MTAVSLKGNGQDTKLPQINRAMVHAGKPAPVRIVHIGLGAFHRAHQAWYTQHSSDGAQWGIAAFTGRRPDAAVVLAAQDGMYTLVTRGGDGDAFELMTSVIQAHDGADVATLAALVAAPDTAIVSLTITEAAYGLAADGSLDTASPAVLADIAVLRAGLAAQPVPVLAAGMPALAGSGGGGTGSPAPEALPSVKHDAGTRVWAHTAPGRVVQALNARRLANAGPLAIVSCDNLANNGPAARIAIVQLAAAAETAGGAGAGLAAWIDANVSFVGTSIDRITPATAAADLGLVARVCGYADSSPVVTEPFSSWVLSGAFPAGRPDWESAGAVFVDDIEPFENRKLWLLNGAHSLLAYTGLQRGHATVAQALADPVCAGWVEDFWNEAEGNLRADGLNTPAYRAALLERFGNARIAHNLVQIATDGSNKLRMRCLPVAKAERLAGRSGKGALRMVAAWMVFLQDRHAAGLPLEDAASGHLAAALELADPVPAILAVLDDALARDADVVRAVMELGAELRADGKYRNSGKFRNDGQVPMSRARLAAAPPTPPNS